MPHFITIAAATGDVIALTPPRRGADQANPFNWVNVLRHEYVHTVTLSQTKNRIPHWFTEACAVSQETTGRTWDTCRMLAHALTQPRKNGGLFDYDQINWGFIRPQQPNDRSLAYAQSDWMLQFIAERWGHNAIVQLLERYREGVSDVAALQAVLNVDDKAFIKDFRAWATTQVAAWGLGPRDTSDRAKAATTPPCWNSSPSASWARVTKPPPQPPTPPGPATGSPATPPPGRWIPGPTACWCGWPPTAATPTPQLAACSFSNAATTTAPPGANSSPTCTARLAAWTKPSAPSPAPCAASPTTPPSAKTPPPSPCNAATSPPRNTRSKPSSSSNPTASSAPPQTARGDQENANAKF